MNDRALVVTIATLQAEVDRLRAEVAALRSRACSWTPGHIDHDACHAADAEEIRRLMQENARLRQLDAVALKVPA